VNCTFWSRRRPDAPDSRRPACAGWVYEPKWVGWQCLAVVGEGRVDVRGRKATDLPPYFPELIRPPVAIAGRRAVLDGEVVGLRNGCPGFDAISGRLAARRPADMAARTSPATFVAFDLRELDGHVLADAPYTARREARGPRPQRAALGAHAVER
jgi:bifunctional non-homologous end joining protein LigD